MTLNADPINPLDKLFYWHVNVTKWGPLKGRYSIALLNAAAGPSAGRVFSTMGSSYFYIEIKVEDDDDDDDKIKKEESMWLQIAGFSLLGVVVVAGIVVAYPRKQQTNMRKDYEFNGYEELLSEHPSITTAFDAMTTNRSDWLVDLKALDMKEMVGIGASAQVFRSIFCGQAVAVKRMPVLIRKGEIHALLEQEAQALSRLHHPNIVGFFGQ